MSLPPLGALPNERRGYVSVGGRQVHYREQGRGPAVVLIHQAPWASIQYRRIMPILASAGYRTIAPDLPGQGLSDPLAPPTIVGFAQLLPALLDSLGETRAALAGQHGGALVAGRMAATYPDRVGALAMDNAPLYTAEQRAGPPISFGTPRVGGDGVYLTDHWALIRQLANPGWSDETIHVALMTYFANGPTAMDAFAAARDYDFGPDVERIGCPTLVMAGRRDQVFPSANLITDRRPDWSYAEFDGGPDLVLDRPEEWCGIVVPFLDARYRTA